MRGSIDLRWWIGGLVAFAIVIAIGAAITQGDVSAGIIEHQQAGSAARVDEIQAQWRAGNVRMIAIAAMIGDLVFIAIYGWGSFVAGRSLIATSQAAARVIGWVVAVAAVLFVMTDYLETVLQFIQLLQERGVDWMAATAAFAQPIKVAAWIATFIGVIAGWGAARLGGL